MIALLYNNERKRKEKKPLLSKGFPKIILEKHVKAYKFILIAPEGHKPNIIKISQCQAWHNSKHMFIHLKISRQALFLAHVFF